MPVTTLQNLDPRFEWITETFFWWWHSYFPCLIIILRLWGVEEWILEGETLSILSSPWRLVSTQVFQAPSSLLPLPCLEHWKVSYLGIPPLRPIVTWRSRFPVSCSETSPPLTVSVHIGAETSPQHKYISKHCFSSGSWGTKCFGPRELWY